ncbi:hypothetical protein ACQ33O_03840 [Ferruginibacter sp. SUN002]|uniref:hypothetical protein n=1 Tax=Ferruginibacter sp. SUN002 TaxID=2937789 RepID=UPI003D362BEB
MQHQKNRRPDAYYIDRYDSSTIKLLKEIEAKKERCQDKISSEYFSAYIDFINTGVFHARRKKQTIEEWIRKDENDDILIETTPIPQNIKCNKCATVMRFERFICIYDNPPILFDFVCHSKSCKERKLIYPDGHEYYIHKTEKHCSVCNSPAKTTVKKTKEKISFIETCPQCGIISTEHYDINEDPIDENNRKKYCTDFINQNTFWEDLQKLGEVFMIIEEERKNKDKKEKIGLNDINILTVHQLEQKLSTLFNSLGYQKFRLGTPSLGKYLTITFTTLDSTIRTERESTKMLLKQLVACLLPTNWRVINKEITYRLGILTGILKAYETDEDLKKIALQILKEKLNQVKN